MSALVLATTEDDLLEDEPRFDYHLELALARSEIGVTFDKERRAFLLTFTEDDGCGARLVMTPRELEHIAIELLLAARHRLGFAWPTARP